MKTYPKVFIIVLNYNGKEMIKNCLSSLFKLDYSNFEVVLVDNNSKDGSLEMAKTNFSKAHFIKNSQNLGFSAGNNVGIRFSLERMAEYVLLINNDTEVEKDFLSHLVEAGEKDSKIGILSPVIFNGEKNKIWFSGGKIDWLKMRAVHEQNTKAEEIYETEYLSGCAMLIKAEVFKKIGLLDEDFFLYYEDADFSIRSRRAGFKNVVVASSWVYHFEKSEEAKLNKIYWLVVSGLIFFKKNTSPLVSPWIRVYVLGRKIKNWLDVRLKKDEVSKTVQRAYKDFKNVKI
jgi:GT2 family glycosyltransferase